MKHFRFLLYILAIIIFVSACQKELTEVKSFATGSLVKIGTECAPINVEGSFKKNSVLTTGNYADIQVNFTTTGNYDIKSDTVNGYSFRAFGQTGLTGMNTVRMQSSGKPLVAGTNVFTLIFGTTTCQININVTDHDAVFTFSGAPNACTISTPAGVYTEGLALTSANSVSVQTNVTTTGAYNISTSTVNGISFSKSGAFSSTGLQTVTLQGSGVPLAPGTFNIITGAGGCTFNLVVAASVTGLPIITTTTVTGITSTAAVSGGNITNAGSSPITARGVCWSTTPLPTITGAHTTDGSGTSVFTSNMTPLTTGTNYYVRAYATNNAGTAYGNEITFVATGSSSMHVYVVGESGPNATIWRDGIATYLTALPNSGSANCVYVSGTDVYVAGEEAGPSGINPIAKIWKNGIPASLTNGPFAAFVNSVYLSGADVYVAGYEYNGTVDVSKVWKNGTATSLTNGTRPSGVFSVYVSGTDVYVAGIENSGMGYNDAKIWKNGVATILTTGIYEAGAYSVFVAGVDVYVAGFENNGTRDVAKLWKNGVITALTNGTANARAFSVYVSGPDVYVAGYENNGLRDVAKLWKNGVAASLSNGSNDARSNSVFVLGTDVYVAGQDNNIATVWKNGVGTALPGGDRAFSIFVQ